MILYTLPLANRGANTGASEFAKYFAVLNVAVPTFETMGLNVSSFNSFPFFVYVL